MTAIIRPLNQELGYNPRASVIDNVAGALEELIEEKDDSDDYVFDYTSVTHHILEYIKKHKLA